MLSPVNSQEQIRHKIIRRSNLFPYLKANPPIMIIDRAKDLKGGKPANEGIHHLANALSMASETTSIMIDGISRLSKDSQRDPCAGG